MMQYTLYCRLTGEGQDVSVCDEHAEGMPLVDESEGVRAEPCDDDIACEFCPPPTHLRASDWRVERVPHAEAAAFIREHHYAKGCSNTGKAFGLRRLSDGALMGAALWLPPTKLAAAHACRLDGKDAERWRGVLALSRLAIHPDVPTNGASFLIGRCVRALRRERVYHLLVTYADDSQGHTGAIYRATNWTEAGHTKPEPRWLDKDGMQVARKATRTNAEMRVLGHEVSGHYCKRRFILRLHG